VVHVHRTTLPLPQPFELPVLLLGHGWVALPPHHWPGGDSPYRTVLRLGAQVVDAELRPRRRSLALSLHAARSLPARAISAARAQLAHALRLGDDLEPFWTQCRRSQHLRWAARRGAGRLLRSPTVFEDLLKLLFTTNTTWSGTTAMTRNLVAAFGPAAPSGARAFPTPAECPRDERTWRAVVRVGYRARACIELCERFATGALTDDHFLDPGLPTADLRRRLLALDGFGPYAAGQAMRLFGRYDDLALDSWCRARIAELAGRRRAPADGAIGRRYAAFGEFAGLALWLELTAEWHGERPRPPAARAGKNPAPGTSWW